MLDCHYPWRRSLTGSSPITSSKGRVLFTLVLAVYHSFFFRRLSPQPSLSRQSLLRGAYFHLPTGRINRAKMKNRMKAWSSPSKDRDRSPPEDVWTSENAGDVEKFTTAPLQRRLQPRHLQMLAIGGTVGTGLVCEL